MIDSYPIYTWNHDARMIFESSTRSACMAGDVVCEIVTQMTSSFALQTICCKQNYAQFFSIRTEALKNRDVILCFPDDLLQTELCSKICCFEHKHSKSRCPCSWSCMSKVSCRPGLFDDHVCTY